jgi:excisionase family DNA binding protein
MELTVPEVALRTGRSPETVRRWIRAGRLASGKVGTQHVVDEKDLAAFLRRVSGGVGEQAAPYQWQPPASMKTTDSLARISLDPRVLAGKPVIRGTRLAVEWVIDLLAGGWIEPQILQSYPGITSQDVRACLVYAAERLRSERVYPLPPTP